MRAGSTLSDTYKQEMGVPQGSILCPILFSLKINNIVKSVLKGLEASLFVDDFCPLYTFKVPPTCTETYAAVCKKRTVLTSCSSSKLVFYAQSTGTVISGRYTSDIIY